MTESRRRGGANRDIPSRTIPEACVSRLSWYMREVQALRTRGAEFVSSRWLGKHLGLTDAQVRRDLSYFGQFGTSGRGYEVSRLHDRLRSILGIADRTWNLALVGVGNLGLALLAHGAFRERGFQFKLALDVDAQKIGRRIQDLTIAPVADLARLAKQHAIQVGVITVPVPAAQGVCGQLVEGGVRSILNFAPVRLEVPASVRVRTVDLAVELEGLAFHLAREHANGSANGS